MQPDKGYLSRRRGFASCRPAASSVWHSRSPSIHFLERNSDEIAISTMFPRNFDFQRCVKVRARTHVAECQSWLRCALQDDQKGVFQQHSRSWSSYSDSIQITIKITTEFCPREPMTTQTVRKSATSSVSGGIAAHLFFTRPSASSTSGCSPSSLRRYSAPPKSARSRRPSP